MKPLTRWVFIVCIPFLLVTGAISLAANCGPLYTRGFNTYDISAVTGLEPAELEKAAAGLRDYFNNSEEYIDITVTRNGEPFTLFNQREVGHLKDVKALFRLGYYVLAGTLVYAAAFVLARLFWRRDRRQIWLGLFGGGIMTLALMAVLGAVMAADFDAFFRQFHLLSFANDLWLLNPATDYLIMLFPRDFWFDAALFCAAGAAAGAIALGITGWLKLRR